MSFFYTVFILCIFTASLPVQCIVWMVIALTSGLPIFFRQKRIGLGGKRFTIYKFRTMGVGAEGMQARLYKRNQAQQPVFKIFDDPRFTPVGKFLSHTGLDELPQLYNVLRGDMALIGPRPLPIDEAKKLAPWMHKRHEVLPGIISPAILSGNYHKNFDAWMKSDVAYAKTKKPMKDMQLLVRSVIFLGRLIVVELFRALHVA